MVNFDKWLFNFPKSTYSIERNLTLSLWNCSLRSSMSFSTALLCSSCFIRLLWAFICSIRSSSANFSSIFTSKTQQSTTYTKLRLDSLACPCQLVTQWFSKPWNVNRWQLSSRDANQDFLKYLKIYFFKIKVTKRCMSKSKNQNGFPKNPNTGILVNNGGFALLAPW